MEHETHLFIIWENGRVHEKPILDDIKTNFQILEVYGVTWSPYLIDKNFTRFYGEKLPKNSHKAQHCGGGEFLLIVIRDNKPLYESRDTSKGIKLVNSNIFDAKVRYRKMTGGGHKIHSTNDIKELKHDLVLLLGQSLADFEKEHTTQKESDDIVLLKKDLLGTNGWASFEELFYALNECSEYLVLRNAENINLDYFSKNKGDVDLLVNDREEVLYILGDLESIDKDAGHMLIDISRQLIPFEVYQIKQNLFPEIFENEIFESKIMLGNIYCPNEMYSFLGLVYHSFLLNRTLSEKHKNRLTAYAKNIGIFSGNSVDENIFLKILVDYFVKKGYWFIPPNDNKIYFNKRTEIIKRFQRNPKRKSLLSLKLSKIIRCSHNRRCIAFTILSPFRNVVSLKINLPRMYSIVILIGAKNL